MSRGGGVGDADPAGSIPTGLPLPGLRLAIGTLSILRVPVGVRRSKT